MLRRRRKPAGNFGRTFRGLGEKQRRILGSYLSGKGVGADKDEGPTEMSNVDNAAACGSDRLAAHFWKSHLLKDYPTFKEYKDLGS